MSDEGFRAENVRVSASILAANHAELGKDSARAEAAGCDELHVDVMDGRFAPNLGFAPTTVAHVRKCTALPLEAHMMVERPADFVQPFLAAGLDIFCVHAESENALAAIREAKNCGLRTAVALLPGTPAKYSEPFLGEVERVSILAVSPGFWGQKMLREVLPKGLEILRMADKLGVSIDLAIDGGVDSHTFPQAFAAGFRVAISGGFLFTSGSMEEAVVSLKSAQHGLNRLSL